MTDVANRGLVRPPLVYLGSIAGGLIAERVLPLPLHEAGVNVLSELATLIAATVLFLLAVRSLRAARTPVPGNRPTTMVVRTGPYRFSRNPIYLSFSLFQLALALWTNSLWVLMALVASVGVMSIVVIPREERYLSARFPSEYAAYKATVRRWL